MNTIGYKRLTKKQNGFTLIELIVVIVILGIIASIAIPKYLDLTTEVKQSVDEVNKKAIEAAVLLYFTQQVVQNSGFTLTQAVNQYNANPASFFADGMAPLKSDGTTYTVQIVGSNLIVN